MLFAIRLLAVGFDLLENLFEVWKESAVIFSTVNKLCDFLI
jgi:hypothetical protein